MGGDGVTRLLDRLREPPFGTETSERNLFKAAADRIEQLERQQKLDHENINIKADAIDRWINTSAEQHERIAQLERELDQWRVNYGKLGLELAAEKALSDDLYIGLQHSGVLASLGMIDYRKARGL